VNKAFTLIKVLLATFFILAMLCSSTLAKPEEVVVVADLNGLTIDLGAQDLVDRAVGLAESQSANFVILQLNTYGGYLKSMDAIIERIVGSHVPVVAFIGPRGAKAVSAGAFIAIASKKIVMAENSVMGSSQPVPADPKIVDYAIERMRTFAEDKYGKGDPRVETAVEFVTINRDLTASQAYAQGMVEYIANDLDGVLTFLNASGAKVLTVSSDAKTQFLSLLNIPLFVGLLIEIGALLIIVEIVTPGVGVFGFIGVSMLLLGLYGLGVLAPSFTVVIILILGIALILLELKKPGFQLFGITGLILTAVAILLAYREQPYIATGTIVYAVLAPFVVVGGIAVFYLAKIRETVMMRKKAHDLKNLIGMTGTVKTDISPTKPGTVQLASDLWTALADEEIKEGEKVQVTNIEGVKLKVKKAA